MTTTEPVSVSVAKAAELLGISTRHAYYLLSEGKLPGAYHPTGSRRVLVHLETLRTETAKLVEGQAS